jgi:hypothetical protein
MMVFKSGIGAFSAGAVAGPQPSNSASVMIMIGALTIFPTTIGYPPCMIAGSPTIKWPERFRSIYLGPYTEQAPGAIHYTRVWGLRQVPKSVSRLAAVMKQLRIHKEEEAWTAI